MSVLKEFIQLDQVTGVLVLDRSGIVRDGISSGGSVDTDAEAAALGRGVAAAKVLGRDLSIGELLHGTLEYEDCLLLVTTLGGHATLVIQAERDANLGRLRLELQRRKKELLQALAG
jgi:predicted regulator of Ras-like GTPase activity (Roadblock/LC7/MglB family)